MVDLILNEVFFLVALATFAVVTPLVCWALWRKRPEWRGRKMIACGLLGPVALVFWGWHNLVLRVLGFDTVTSLAVVLASGVVMGVVGGWWVRD